MAIEITGEKKEVTVGELIDLGVKYTKEWGVLKSVEWTVPGTVVKGYTDGQMSAKVTALPEADKKRFTLRFYWVDGADGRKVEAKCVFTSSGKDVNKTLSATFDVKAPVMDKFGAATDRVRLLPRKSPSRASFGNNFSPPGILWDWKITVPGTHDCDIKDVQTIRLDNRATTTAGTKVLRAVPGTKTVSPDYHLDTDNPYSLPGDFPPCPGFPHRLGAGASFSNSATLDTPSNPLGPYKFLTVDRFFRYYIMYKPVSAGSIWVPVAKAEWNCVGEAHLGAKTKKWSLSGTGGGITSAGASTTEFPEYSSNSKYHLYVNA